MSKHASLAAQLQRRIMEGTYPAGTKLPSIRQMAQEQQCSKSTVIQAYEQLISEHDVYVVDRSGYYVAVQERKLPERIEQQWIDMASAAPAAEIFPFDDFQSCLNQAMKLYRDQLFTYGMPQGLPELLIEVKQQLEQVQVFAPLSRLYITSGVQQALSILAMMPFPSGRQKILIEQPGYHLLIEMLETMQIPVEQVERTSSGLDWERIEMLFGTGEIKFFYIMTRFHNPLGTSLTAAQKKRLLALAVQYDVYLVEDDYLADLEQSSSSDPLYAYDVSDHVIYLKSYSKMLFPGLRIGAAVLPDRLTESFARYKKFFDIDSSVLSQAALHMYIKNGMFARYRRLILEAYQQRSRTLHAALQSLAANDPLFINVEHTQTIHTVIPLPDNFPTVVLIRRLAEQHIIVDSLQSYFLKNSRYARNGLRINVSNVPNEQIEPSLQRVASEIKRLMITPVQL